MDPTASQFARSIVDEALTEAAAEVGNPIEKYGIALAQKVIDRSWDRVTARIAAKHAAAAAPAPPATPAAVAA